MYRRHSLDCLVVMLESGNGLDHGELIGQQHFCQSIKALAETESTNNECSFWTSPLHGLDYSLWKLFAYLNIFIPLTSEAAMMTHVRARHPIISPLGFPQCSQVFSTPISVWPNILLLKNSSLGVIRFATSEISVMFPNASWQASAVEL